jgi:predicted nucleic acid-binding protein
MPGIIVSDTSCLILLDKLGRIDLLKSLFSKITITDIIAKEFGKVLPDFVEIRNPQEKNYQRIFETFLDSGEASAFALAIEINDCLLIIDDFKARREAKQLKLNFTGTIGILIVAIEKGYIENVSVLIDDIKRTNFRISEKYVDEIINRFNKSK